ncbi:MAG TPA: NADP oxidoreductase [Nitrospiraceae bacterium]|nr:MAG: NADP oxidoreductase [Nitrospirae bacterium GWA2_46_11]OGW24016.1 MAG: NADP oxidoreductase [Nitrospirae bacterium GWB2_47_37]HAK88832.1 NADP oxidoreductase [Nitrospiraceae bacterium]HCL81404.1 NADP oxidoreductase [Nitrospiraceae bacterium]HCZ12592.1 NADP oxidoreductase [Nitrospiraceae bacterium]
MARLTVDDLKKIKEEYKSTLTLREGGSRAKITVHMGTCGIAAGARKVMEAVLDEINKNNVKDVIVTNSGCAGLCSKEPMATVEIINEAPVKYVQLNEDKIRKIFKEHVMEGSAVQDYALVVGSETAY